jgi:AraC-like DNA-binding protein
MPELSMPRTIVASYREFAPHRALSDHVRAFFSFVPGEGLEESAIRRAVTRRALFAEGDSFCSPLLASGSASLVLDLGLTCNLESGWRPSADTPRGKVIGPMTRVGQIDVTERSAMLGVYFKPAAAPSFVPVAASELTDLIVPLDDVWPALGSTLAAEAVELNEEERIDRLEKELLRRLGRQRRSGASMNVPGLAAWVHRSGGQLTVERLADSAGVSRQHLTRVFRESVGVTPKLYCRLARFHSGLAYAARTEHGVWARVAAQLGYADQSHMIAEFKEFSSLTPEQLSDGRWFHPFIENARASHDDGKRLD